MYLHGISHNLAAEATMATLTSCRFGNKIKSGCSGAVRVESTQAQGRRLSGCIVQSKRSHAKLEEICNYLRCVSIAF